MTSICAARISLTWRSIRRLLSGLSASIPHGIDSFTVIGDLSIRGITKEVNLEVDGPTAPVKDPWGNIRAGISASTKISRKDFGVAFNALTETGGVVVGDEVKITIEAELIQESPAA